MLNQEFSVRGESTIQYIGKIELKIYLRIYYLKMRKTLYRGWWCFFFFFFFFTPGSCFCNEVLKSGVVRLCEGQTRTNFYFQVSGVAAWKCSCSQKKTKEGVEQCKKWKERTREKQVFLSQNQVSLKQLTKSYVYLLWLVWFQNWK